MARPRSRSAEALLFVAIVVVALVAIIAGSMALRSSNDAPMTQSGAGSPSAAALSSPGSEPQICASCWGDGAPDPQVTGAAVVEDGVQVLKVGLVDGYYQPNDFSVQAGIPVTVVFSGNAEGCLAEPEFPELGVKGDMSGGTATMDLGTLKPGKYTFTCSMGVNEGTITVK